MNNKQGWMDAHFGTSTERPRAPQQRGGHGTAWGLAFAGVVAATVAGWWFYVLPKQQTTPTPIAAHTVAPSRAVRDSEPNATVTYSARLIEQPAEIAPPAMPNTQRTASLRRGIDLMQREYAIADASMAKMRAQFVVRDKKGRSPPWAAAETIEEAAAYLRQEGLTQAQVLSAQDGRRNAEIELRNCTKRIRELTAKKDSLSRRIKKAESELP